MIPYKATQQSARLLAALKEKNIRFAHWKGNNHLLQSLEGKTDIELLINPADRSSFEAIMGKLEFKKLVSQPWHYCPGVEDWIGFDQETGNLLHLHTHYDLATGITYGKNLFLPWMDEFFKHLKPDQQTGWPIPEPELEAIILLIRIYAKLECKDRDALSSKKDELVELLRRSRMERFITVCRALRLNTPEHMGARLNAIIKESSSAEIIDLAAFFYDQLPPSKRGSRLFSNVKFLYYKYYLKVAHKTSPLIGPLQFKKAMYNGGKIIALIGSDGSGKSTLTKDLTNWLTFKIDAHYFYMGKKPFIRSYDKQLFSKTDIFFYDGIVAKGFRKLAGNLYYVLVARQKTKMLRQAKHLSRQGSLIICDRFPQKDVLGFNDGPKLQNGSSNMYAKMEMRQFHKIVQMGADLVFRLKVSPEIASKRKPEHDYAMIKQKCDNINKISYERTRIIDIDAGRPYEQVLLELKREIWKNL